jgi:hypothetical protein
MYVLFTNGSENIDNAVDRISISRKLYSNKQYVPSQYNHIEEDFDEWESEDDIRDNQDDQDSWYSPNPEHQHPENENENDRKRKIGLAIGARKGDIIEYFESDSKGGYSLDAKDISTKKYKVMLWKAVKGILDIAGYDIATIEHELVLNNINRTTKQSLQVAWLGSANLQTGGER